MIRGGGGKEPQGRQGFWSKLSFSKLFSKLKFSVSDKNNLKNKVGWAFSPTLKYCWGRTPNLHKNCDDLIGKKSINSSPCHPELVSGSSHRQKCSAICTQKTNVRLKAQPTLIPVSSCRRSIVMQGLRPHLPRRAAFTLAEVFSPYYLSPHRIAFTLAEVLITLGIIGVVAAMTLPVLTAKFRKIQTVNLLKANYSILNTAINNASVEYGTNIDDWPILGAEGYERSLYFAEHYIAPYLKVIINCKNISNTDDVCSHTLAPMTSTFPEPFSFKKSNGFATMLLANGSIISVRVWENYIDDRPTRVHIFIDINGLRGPNIQGIDGFLVELGGSDHNKTYNKFLPYGYSSTRNRSVYIGNTTEEGEDGNGCNSTRGNGNLCFALILHDGWEIKSDYPWK